MLKNYLTKTITLVAVAISILALNSAGVSAKITQNEAKEIVKQNFDCIKDFTDVTKIRFTNEINKSDKLNYQFNFTRSDENLYRFNVAIGTGMYVGVDSGSVYLDEGGIARWFSWIENGKRIKTWDSVREETFDNNGKFTGHKVYWEQRNGWKSYGNWYYYKDGVMQTGWIYDNGNWYYCYSTGQMAHDTTIGGYHLNSSGARTN